MSNYIEVGNDWMVDMNHLEHETVFVANISTGISVNLRKTDKGLEVRTFALPDLEAKHFVTVETGE